MGVVPKTTWKRSLKRLQSTKKHFPEGEIIHWCVVYEFYVSCIVYYMKMISLKMVATRYQF